MGGKTPESMNAVEAGAVLGLPADVVRVLADTGYLPPASLRGGVPRFALGDLKAFQARASDTGDGLLGAAGADELDLEGVLPLLDAHADVIARRTLEALGTVLPEVLAFTDAQREQFVTEAQDRIRAVLAVCATGPGADPELEHDLAEIGADAAHGGVPLTGVLMVLRIARDLVVQTAVELAEERGRRWSLALAVALTRVLPAIDRLSDAVARGYWEALLEIEVEGVDRFRHVAASVGEGVFCLDAGGVVTYANPALVAAVGPVVGRAAHDALGVAPGVDGAAAAGPVRQFERLRDGVVVGWDGVVGLGQRRLDGGEHAGAAPGVVDVRDGVGDEALRDVAERLGGGTVAEDDRRPAVAAEGDGGLEGHAPE